MVRLFNVGRPQTRERPVHDSGPEPVYCCSIKHKDSISADVRQMVRFPTDMLPAVISREMGKVENEIIKL